MDGITQMLLGSTEFALNANFICNLMVFCIVIESVSVIVGHLASIGR